MAIWGKTSAKPLRTSTRRCDAGHPMAMDWQTCPYCEAARNASEKTRLDARDNTAMPDMGTHRPVGPTRINQADDQSQAPAGNGRRTQIDPLAGDPFASTTRERARTVVRDPGPGGAETGRPRAGNGRRLTGILFTFDTSPMGEIFEVREGRNYGGSGTISMEGQRLADVHIPGDDQVSSAHFLILCQPGAKYRISDCNSTNGTYVNGKLIDNLGIDLKDGSLILAGATKLIFKKVLPPDASVGQVDYEEDPEGDVAAPAFDQDKKSVPKSV